MPYIGFEPTASDTLSVFKYVATGSQTTFTGADAGGATLSYDVGDGSCQVWLNGVRLDSSDITATNGTSVVLAACTAGDIVHVQATKAFIPADVVSASAGGTFASAVTVSGDVTGTTINATGDTSAGDNAAVWYTAAEGLVLTGQGSTSDIAIKNDADQNVMTVATGTQTAHFPGHVTVAGNVTVTGGLIFDHETLDIYDEGTWSPILRPYTTEFGSITYNSLRIGKYVIIGHLCHFSFTMRTDAITVGSGSGDMNIFGFPATPANDNNHYKVFFAACVTSSFAGEHPSEIRLQVGTFANMRYNADHSTAETASAIADMDTGSDKNWFICNGVYETT